MIVAIVVLGRAFLMRGCRLIVEVAMDDRRIRPCRIGLVQMLCRQRAQERERQQACGRSDRAAPGSREQGTQYVACQFRKSTAPTTAGLNDLGTPHKGRTTLVGVS